MLSLRSVTPNTNTTLLPAMIAPGWNGPDSVNMRIELSSSASPVNAVTAQELANIEQLARMALQSFKEQKSSSGYDPESVKMMSDTLDQQRSLLLSDQANVPTVANMFGAFLGKTIIEWSEGFPSRWIRSGDEIGVEVIAGDRTARFFPISRVFRQIEQGKSQTAYGMFKAALKLLQEAADKAAAAEAAAKARPASDTPIAAKPVEAEKANAEMKPDAAVKPETVAKPEPAVQAVSPQDLAQLEQLAAHTVQFYRKHLDNFGYDERSVKLMSKHLDKQRAKLQADKTKIQGLANMYGAYLGKAIIASNPQALSRWIRSGDELGVEMVNGSYTSHAYTASRILQQIESGEKTAYELFLSMQVKA
ncbi:MAG TPA: hypothetical protein VF472_04615 [Burkholderiaceae bacterium]